jgi:hypothetical protein
MKIMTNQIVVSFSLSAVARLGVPPGKWFCLARTGLGYEKYSCCVCKRHSEAFLQNWRSRTELIWKDRIKETIHATLHDMEYNENSEGMLIMQERTEAFVFDKANYIINPTFSSLLLNDAIDVRIITAGPRCLTDLVFPEIPQSHITTEKKSHPLSYLSTLSDVHVGSSIFDLQLSQTRAISARKPESLGQIPSHIPVYPALTDDVPQNILPRIHISTN